MILPGSIKKRVLFSLALLVFLSGCVPGAGKVSPSTEAVPEEKRLTLYTSHKEEVYGPIVKEFEERTGIWVDVHAGGTTELLEIIGEEQKKGQSACDVMFGGGVESYEASREYFEPYRVAAKDKLNERYVSRDDCWTAFTELPIVLIYNNKLVGEDEAPDGFGELFSDSWRGKIAFADPANSGSSCTMLATMVQILGMSEDETLERFAGALDGHMAESSGEAVEEVAAGRRLVGITLEETAKKWIARGADLAIVYPKEGTSALPDGCAIVKAAPHMENAELFLEFIVSDDVQRFCVEHLYRRSVRLDMASGREKEAGRIVDFDLTQAAAGQETILKKWAGLMNEEHD
ncbi:MAG: extracellular solute-binding protein [Lachnospiraceae bacterium]|nr:extracellular solute-binding protein [Lachnospiraceae bacterium]